MMENKFDFNDFLKQFKMVSGMSGGMTNVMKMLPGASLIKLMSVCHSDTPIKISITAFFNSFVFPLPEIG